MPQSSVDIVIVDDNEVLASVLSEILKECGHKRDPKGQFQGESYSSHSTREQTAKDKWHSNARSKTDCRVGFDLRTMNAPDGCRRAFRRYRGSSRTATSTFVWVETEARLLSCISRLTRFSAFDSKQRSCSNFPFLQTSRRKY